MVINVGDLGYREIARLAKFMLAVSKYGIYDDVAHMFYYDLKNDEPYLRTEKHRKITASDLGLNLDN